MASDEEMRDKLRRFRTIRMEENVHRARARGNDKEVKAAQAELDRHMRYESIRDQQEKAQAMEPLRDAYVVHRDRMPHAHAALACARKNLALRRNLMNEVRANLHKEKDEDIPAILGWLNTSERLNWESEALIQRGEKLNQEGDELTRQAEAALAAHDGGHG
jgi:hypothetical protein